MKLEIPQNWLMNITLGKIYLLIISFLPFSLGPVPCTKSKMKINCIYCVNKSINEHVTPRLIL